MWWSVQPHLIFFTDKLKFVQLFTWRLMGIRSLLLEFNVSSTLTKTHPDCALVPLDWQTLMKCVCSPNGLSLQPQYFSLALDWSMGVAAQLCFRDYSVALPHLVLSDNLLGYAQRRGLTQGVLVLFSVCLVRLSAQLQSWASEKTGVFCRWVWRHP